MAFATLPTMLDTNTVLGLVTMVRSGKGWAGKWLTQELIANGGSFTFADGSILSAIVGRGSKRGGHVYAPSPNSGRFALVRKGKSIELFGCMSTSGNELDMPYSVEFSVGESAEYDSFNLSYYGDILSIGEKRVVIKHKHSDRKSSLDLHTFDWRNHDFSAGAAFERNSETMMYI